MNIASLSYNATLLITFLVFLSALRVLNIVVGISDAFHLILQICLQNSNFVGISEDQFEQIWQQVTGIDISSQFASIVRTPGNLMDVQNLLANIGVSIVHITPNKVDYAFMGPTPLSSVLFSSNSV